MLFKTLLPSLVALVYIGKVAARPQITATLPFVPDDGPDDLDDFNDDDRLASGYIAGTGANGETTYILTMTEDDDDDRIQTITATLIAGPSGATVVAAYDDLDDDDDDDDDDDGDEYRSVGCGIQGDTAVCTYIRGTIIGGTSTSTTLLTTRTAAADRVTLVASTGSPTQTSPSTTGTGSTTSSRTSSTGTGTSSADDSSQTSGAQQQLAVGYLASTLSAVLAVFVMA